MKYSSVDIHEEEIKTTSMIFSKSDIPNLKKLTINEVNEGKEVYTDIDVIGIYKNVIILVECVGKETIKEKEKKFIGVCTKLEKDLNLLLNCIKEKDCEFFSKNCKDIVKLLKNEREKVTVKRLLTSYNKEFQEEEINNKKYKVDSLFIWDISLLKYFEIISNTTFKHCRYELFTFFDIKPKDIDEKGKLDEIECTVIEKTSNRTVVVFEMKANELLKRTFVLRYYGWAGAEGGFQRILNEKKLREMRNYLLEGEVGYPNNIIVIIPSDIEIKCIKDSNYKFNLPEKFDTLCIIDGQHRLYSFAQDQYSKWIKIKGKTVRKLQEEDKKITDFSEKMNFIVTGVQFKNEEESKKNYPIKLFYEINTKQTKLSSEDVIDLTSILNEKLPQSKANNIIKQLNKEGPLINKIRTKFYHEGRLYRTTLIRYAGLLEMFNPNSKTYSIFFEIYKKQKKVIKKYDDFCLELIKIYLSSLKEAVEDTYKTFAKEVWEDTRKEKYYLMSVTSIGAFLRLLRHFVSKRDKKFEELRELIGSGIKNNEIQIKTQFKECLKIITKELSFERTEWKKMGYKSSQWALLESFMFNTIRNHSGIYKNFGDESLIKR